MAIRLILTRHGLTDYNAQRRYQGRVDIPLNETGLAQARLLQKRLAAIHLDGAYTSDLQRAATTAQIALEGHPSGLTAKPEPLFREISGGKFEGMVWDDIIGTYPEEAAAWQADRINVAPPEGENLLEVTTRIAQALDKIVKEQTSEDASVLLVLHGGILSVMLCQMMGMSLDRLWQWRVDNCSLTILDIYPQGAILSLFNDITHIDESAKSPRH